MVPIVLAGLVASASPSSPCPALSDKVKQGYFRPVSFTLDVDGDGKPDTITPRLTVTHYRDKSSRLHSAEWIVFDLKTSRGRSMPSFFTYRYGTDRIDYWAWALVCTIRSNGRRDLIFYSGDDTSDETVVLANEGNRYRVVSRTVRDNEGRPLKRH